MELMFDSECFEKSCKYSLLRFFFYTPPFVKYVKECEFSNNLKWKFNKTMMFREIELKNLHVFNYATRELLLSNDFKDDLIDYLLYIKCCPPELARNKKDLAKSIDHIGDCFQKSAQCQTNLSDDLKNDREFWNCFILDRYYEFFNVPEHLQQDREFILPLISKQGKLLQYLGPLLRNDFTIVMKAVSQNGLCLEYAPLALRNDHSIVKAATCQNPLALQFVPTELQPEWKEKFLVEMYQDPTKACALLEIFPEEMGNNEQVVLTSAKCHKEYPHAFKFASSKLKRSRDFVLKFIEQGGGLCLAYVPIEFIED
ncbi:hypothetical protein C9374_010058 [Naegleria lovaniensis]|uniref:DUF4116 domain-containing protein n=1 Tax=Naegleria lovaniensis TaxID=51637 RepID=A0AA88GGW0_NAELO|nr:uncharacterized protein C9374_010058 [Naegleria lovaniensis]KAG2375054.1 hypothetical protein C9374_010058 [Naegleria lovaniensis]